MYPTADELIAASTVTELIELTPDQQEGMRQAAVTAIEAHCNQSFEPVVETRIVDGTRKRKLYLPKRLEELTSVSVGGAVLSSVELAEDGDFIELPPGVGLGYYEQTLREVSGERWYGFDGQLSITGTWGWTLVPDPVKTALRLDMEEQALADTHELSSTITSYRKLGVASISQGNLRMQLGDEIMLSPRVQRQLARYVWAPPGELV